MYVFGGSAEPEHRCFDDLFVLDLETNVWSKPDMVSTRPPALMGHSATHVTLTEADGSVGDYIYVLGGFTFSLSSGQAESTSWENTLWILNVKTLTWTKAAFAGTPMTPRQGHSATLVKTANGDARIFVYGGYTESGMSDSSLLALKTVADPATGQYKWQAVTVEGAKPAARQGHAAALLAQRYFVIVGGYQGEGGQSLNDVHVIDTASPTAEGKLQWQAITTKGPDARPSPREDMATVVLPGRTELAVIGGCAYPSGECYNDVRVLAVEDGSWSWLPTKVLASALAVSPREELTAVVVPREDVDGTETKLLVFGGGKKDEETFSDAAAVVMEARNTKCVEGCSGHGTCDLGDCVCDEGFFGAVCARFCPNNCNGHGTCNKGVCACEAQWKGDGCNEHLCPSNCNGNGKCGEDGKCTCKDEFFGDACDKTCDPECGDHGTCGKDLKCKCDKGFTGDLCKTPVSCPDKCSGNGVCNEDTGKCTCSEGFTGAACSKKSESPCPNGCSDHGTCKADATCECEAGYDGDDCATKIHHVAKTCPNACSGHGTCNDDFTCKCIESHGRVYYGVDCGQSTLRTVKLTMEKGPCTPDGFLVVPANNQAYQTLTIQVMSDAGIPEEVPCPVASSADVNLTTSYTYRPEGSDQDVTVSVPLRRVGNRLLMVRPDAPKTKVEVAVPKAATGMTVPDVPALKSLSTGDVLVLSPGTDTEEEAIVKSVGGQGVAGADAMRFRSGSTLSAEADAGEEIEFAAPLKFAHPSPVVITRASPGSPPAPLPPMAPLAEPVTCPGCSKTGGHCVKNADGEGECKCFTGFSGSNCDVIVCPNNCTSSDQGTCAKGTDGTFSCKCKYGYNGADCSDFTGCGDLGRGCGEHGNCREKTETLTKGGVTKTHTFGFCDCHSGWRGPLCNVAACPNNCTANVADPEKPHGECVSDGRRMACSCKMGWKGDACATPDPCPKDCSGHGACSSDNPNEVGRHCECTEGWSGQICAHPEPVGADPCPLDCSGNGACHHGQCACHRGWAGTACNEPIPCTRNCSGNGKCDGGVCACFKGWTGEDCSALRTCKNQCSGRGRCVLGACVCAQGWVGEDCSTEAACPEDCNDHGKCKNGLCECSLGWSGADCSINHSVDCDPADCSGHGSCHLGKCYCHPGYDGEGCDAAKACPTGPSNDGEEANAVCRGNGVCQYGKCFCAPGYEGDDCSDSEECPTSSDSGLVCSGHGYCDGAQGKCFCAAGYDGAACERGAECPENCTTNGFCFNGKCQCDIGFAGADCSSPVTCPGTTDDAPDGCSGNGNCLRGKCYCAPGFSGEDCAAQATCPSNCADHGRCSGGLCFCDPGYKGEDCSEAVTCPDKCNGRGVCMLGTCVCHEGFAGRSCDLHMPCPDDCSGKGDCMQGECICDGGYSGISCSQGDGIGHACPNNCTGQGTCRDGVCACDPGFTGRSCRRAIPCPANCSGHGLCAHGRCFCDPGFTGRSCHITVPCKDDCSGHGQCARGQCFCADGFSGDNCAQNSALVGQLNALEGAECPKGLENAECSNHGRCESGQCTCESGWYGADCSSATVAGECPNRCSSHGVCLEGKCECVPGWTGEDCSRIPLADLRASAEACASSCEHGSCTTGSCVCEENWTGAACDEAICPDSCTLNPDGTANGLCTSGRCICNAGFAGASCSLSCPSKCSGHGTCQTPLGIQDPNKAHCYCSPGWGGDDCSKVMVKKEGMQMNALLAVALITFIVGLCAIPLVRTYQARRALKLRRNIIYGPQGMEDEGLSAHMGGAGSA